MTTPHTNPGTTVARCSCGKTYTRAEWNELDLVGYQEFGGTKLELRNCTCSSTQAVPVPMGVPVPVRDPISPWFFDAVTLVLAAAATVLALWLLT